MVNQISAAVERWLEHVVVAMIGVASRAVVWPRSVKRGVVILGDAALGVVAVWVAFSLRLGEWRLLEHWAVLRYTLILEQGHGAAPEEIFAADRALQVLGVLWVIVFGLGVYVG